ncbi:MAG: MFS transporter [Candidatus Thermofonsia Clade 1 bacterium]|uniref:MFS transporter n=1 Tax=Candidatus Thermofonsia Clade 1 bacterium TaxID=2364210 RepID=A0A2M8P0C6_9CHLR|nr:MAG: MFS transporter [Candidatus Thermofonsia Clade 1 bacterium]
MAQVEQRWLTRDVVGLALNRFLSDFGHEAGTAVLPLFLTLLGAPPFALGLIEAVSDGLSSAFKLVGGWIGDRVQDRRGFAAIAYAVTGITTGMYALASTWLGVLAARAVGWAGRGFRSPLHDALLADAVPSEARGRAFGLDEAADTLGAIGGPAIALLLVTAFAAGESALGVYQLIFVLGMVPGLLAAASILFLVRERPDRTVSVRSFSAALGALPPRFRRYLIGIAIFGAGDFSHTLLILYAVTVLSPSLGTESANSLAILLYTVHNLFYAVGAYPFGWLADRIGKRTMLIAAYCLAVLMNLLLIGTPSAVIVVALIFILGGVVYAAQQALERAIAADLVDESVRSTGFGVLATVNGVGDFISSLVVGALWTAFSPSVAFGYSLLMTALGTVAIGYTLGRREAR